MDENTKYEIVENPEIPTEEKKDFVFIREEIKNRPVNKGKLARSTMISAVSAVVFGLVACITFAVVLPMATGYLGRDKQEEENDTSVQIIFPEETKEEEMSPEDMLQTQEPALNIEDITAQIEEKEIRNIVENIDIDITVEDYQKIYTHLSEIADEAMKSVVRVRTVSNDTDWFANLLQEESEAAGLIIAQNDNDIFIVSYANRLQQTNNIYVTFSDGTSARAVFKCGDPRTGLCVMFVPTNSISKDTLNEIKAANLGSSNSSKLAGALVLAIGSPMGTYGSVNYGIITSYGVKLSVPDNSYKRITTDCYGSLEAGGILVNLSGEVLGIISTDFSDASTPNLINAIGISELKKNIENMINGKELIRFGVNGSDVPSEAQEEYGAPKGAFILSVEMDSPAMAGGIQAGDIVVGVKDKTITNYSELVSAIKEFNAREEVIVKVVRMSQGEYKELSLTVVPEALK